MLGVEKVKEGREQNKGQSGQKRRQRARSVQRLGLVGNCSCLELSAGEQTRTAWRGPVCVFLRKVREDK